MHNQLECSVRPHFLREAPAKHFLLLCRGWPVHLEKYLMFLALFWGLLRRYGSHSCLILCKNKEDYCEWKPI
jgi:hypothetical protein